MSIDRSLLTDLILSSLEPASGETRQWYVGDHEKPPQGGWTGQEGRSDWIPYMILTATPSQDISGDIERPHGDVWFGYALTNIAISRGGADKIAHAGRERLEAMQRQKTADGRTIAKVTINRYGGIDRISGEPVYWLVTDQFRFYTTT